MNQIDIILEKEKKNIDSIFIYYVGGQFVAFARSAFFVSLLCPQLDVSHEQTDAAGSYFYIRIPDKSFKWLIEKHKTLADDEYICITPPHNIIRQRDYYEYWEVQLYYKHGITKQDQ